MSALSHHLAALPVLLPLFGGLLAPFMGRGMLPWLWSLLITALTASSAFELVHAVQQSASKTVIYNMGNWPGEYGIELRVDPLNAYLILVVAFIGWVSTIYARRSVEDEIPKDRHNFFYSVWLLAIAGLLGIAVTGDTFNIYVLLEISSLTVYTLIAMGGHRDRRAYVASLKYLILGSIGATFILLGIGYLLMLTGTLNMADMHTQLEHLAENEAISQNRTVLVAFAFLVVGLGLKMALFPLHVWLPNAYTYAPSAVSALVAATATKVGIYMAFRFLFSIFGGIYGSEQNYILMTWMASAGIIVSSIRAIQQSDVKRILAYSSVGQLAYIVLGFALLSPEGMTSALLHIANHALIKGGMFMAVGCVALRVGGTSLRDFRGLGRRMPWSMAAFTAGGLGLIGVPLTAGFISKWYLIRAAWQSGDPVLLPVVLVGGLLALIYVWRVVEVIYFQERPKDAPEVCEAPLSMVVATWILVGLSLVLGVSAVFTVELAEAAADVLIAPMGGQ